MIEFLIFCAYVVACVAIGALLYWGLQSAKLPNRIKVTVVIVVAMIGLIYFLNSGYMPTLKS